MLVMATKLEQLQQRKAAIDKAIALERTKAKSAQRRLEDRRKVLVGAFVLDQLQRAGMNPALLTFEGKKFSEWLTRDDERALFDLPAAAPQGGEKS